MTELTAEKIRLVALAIADMRLKGSIAAHAEVSRREMERISHELGHPVSARDIARFETRALEKARLAALALQSRRRDRESPDSL